jgi:GAF domain-containing protein
VIIGQRSLNVFVRLILTLATPRAVEAALAEVAVTAIDLLGLSGAGAALTVDGRLISKAATGEAGQLLEDVQQQTQTGPCQDAIADGRIIAVADLDTATTRWPQFIAAARRVAVGSVAAMPMHADHVVVGALALYAPPKPYWKPEELAVGEILAGLATGVVRHAAALRDSEELALHLDKALASRVIIEQAKGMISEANHIAVPVAFERIRRYARGRHTSVRAVSEEIVTSGLRV